MGIADNIKHGAEEAGGKIEKNAGAVTENDSLESEGKTDEGKADEGEADLKQAGDSVKDAFKK